MVAKWIEALTGSLDQKKQYKRHMARVDALPEPYGSAAKALNRYFLYYGGFTDGDTLIAMIGDHADMATTPTCGSEPRSTALPCAPSSGTTRWSSRRHSPARTPARSGSTRSAGA
ncbi:DUF1048 domain-containing protein [Dietzia sp. SYD-A1]|uniref:DUF1048 domain-containing protein n=1 Tax=Dietzia sp. SYD-A1 TaxID=2780141 RepID=UPI001E2D0D26|nr:DUF1048 domain-containing protein [Dietzia sp. SYD-A1]